VDSAGVDEMPNTTPFLVDTHAHLQWPSLLADVDAVLTRAHDAGVRRILTLGTDPASCRAAVDLAERHAGVYAAVGVHPGDVVDDAGAALDSVAPLLDHPRVVAIGETGLDYYHDDNPPRALQRASFERHLDLAARTGKPICIHSRESGDDVLRLLEARAGRVTAVLHCYTGDLATAQRALALGCYLSFAGNATYPKLRDLLAVAAAIPADRLLLETDAPFLAPQPRRGRRNEPANVAYTYEAIAAARGATRASLGALVGANAARLFQWGGEYGEAAA
jgi:TatD DNase family protein